MYKPTNPFNVPFLLQKRTLVKKNGVNVETYTDTMRGFCSCINYATNQMSIADIKANQDVWNMETYYTNVIKSGDHIKLLDDGSIYEIIGVPENVRRENQYLRFKGMRISG